MTNEDFLKEALASSDCPSDFEKKYNYFCKFQQKALDAAREFARVCSKNGIHYQLAFGSLLGAIRDGGQIPWDYDVDMVVPFSERDKLVEALNADLDKDFDYYLPGRDPGYYPPFIRIVPHGYPHQMIHVDVFYLLGVPDDEPERTKYAKEARDRYQACKYMLLKPDRSSYSFKSMAKLRLLKIYYLLKYGKKRSLDTDSIFGKYDLSNTKNAITVSVGIGKRFYPSGIFLDSRDCETRDGVFKIPSNYETLFKIRYGDWTVYFPVKDRIAEVEKHCAVFLRYQSLNMLPPDAPAL